MNFLSFMTRSHSNSEDAAPEMSDTPSLNSSAPPPPAAATMSPAAVSPPPTTVDTTRISPTRTAKVAIAASLGRAATPLRQTQSPPATPSIFIAAMSAFSSNIADALGTGVDGNSPTQAMLGAAAKYATRSQAALNSSSCSNSSNNSSNSSLNKSNVIEEMLIQINDKLTLADLNEEQQTMPPYRAPHDRKTTTPSPSTVTAPFTLCENANVTLKSINVVAKSPVSAQPVRQNNVSELDDFSSFSEATATFVNNSNIKSFEEFNEDAMLELPPIFKAAEDTFNTCDLFLNNNDGDAGIQSDNELFVECQSYQNTPNKSSQDIGAEASDLDTYRSAVNSSPVSNNIEDDLNFTLADIPDLNDDIMALPHTLERSLYKSDDKGNELTETKSDDIQKHVDNSFDEPMDVDVSLTEFDQNQYEKNVTEEIEDEMLQEHRKGINISMQTNNLNIENKYTTLTQEVFNIQDLKQLTPPTTSVIENILNTSEEKSTESSTVQKHGIGENMVNISASEILNKNAPSPSPVNSSLTSEPVRIVNPLITQSEETAIQASKCSSFDSGLNRSFEFQNNTLQCDKSTEEAQNQQCEKLEENDKAEKKNDVPSRNINSPEQVGSPENLNVTIELKSPANSRKCSTASQSPTFPIKVVGDESQFPRSPNKDDKERQMRFLEKSEYAEKLNKQLTAMEKHTSNATLDNNETKLYSPSPNNRLQNKARGPLNVSNEINISPNLLNATFDSPAISTPNPSKMLTAVNDKTIRRTFTLSSPVILNRTLNGVESAEDGDGSGTPSNEKSIVMTDPTETVGDAEILNETIEFKDECNDNATTISGRRRTFTLQDPEIKEKINEIFNTKIMDTDVTPTVSLSPKLGNIPTLSSSNNNITTPPTGTTQSLNSTLMFDNDNVFKMPLTARSQQIPIVQKRKSIHFLNNDKESPIELGSEFLSAKEQTKSNNKDEKDNSHSATPSPLDEMLVSSTVFDPAAMMASDDQFADDDFKCSNVIFNESDFNYLLTKGNCNVQADNRNSVLLRFDPLFGVPVLANTNNLQQQLLTNNISSNQNNNNNITSEIDVKRGSIVERCSIIQGAKSLLKGRKDKDSTQSHLPARKKKNVNMSVDVIDNNDCNKTFDSSNSTVDEKQSNYKMDELEKKIKNEVLKTEDVEKKLKDAELKEEALIKRVTEKEKSISKLNGVIEAYEKAIAELIAEKEQLIQNYEKQLTEIKADRDSNYHHLTSLETTFSDLHVKYEKSKEMTLQLKANEEALLADSKQSMENARLQGQRYEKMKNHALQQLEIANKKLETLTKEHAIEITKLKASLKKEEISRASINEQLQQKTRENAELVKICDELINGQGS